MLLSGHLDEDDLERYALNQISEPELARVEEHLLLCVECQDACIAVQQEIDVIRRALGRPE